MTANPCCPNCRDCERACFNCERMGEIRSQHAEEGRVAMTACPIAKGARVTRKGDGGEKWAGEVVGRSVRRNKRDQAVVVCRVCWDRMRNGGRRFGGGVSFHSDVQAGQLQVLG